MIYPNLQHWRHYTRDYPSPESYITAAWLYIIGSCLQRRVWIDSGKTIFPNQYIGLIGRPGVGKSITDDIVATLQFYDSAGKPTVSQDNPDYLFPVSANSTSAAKFMDVLARKPQWVNWKRPAFPHSSASFVLDELTSIFKKNAEEMMTFLITAYGCPPTYIDDKVSAGTRFIKNMCVNIFGGTQPDTFNEMRNSRIIGTGFFRRTILIYESLNRSRMFCIPPHDNDQIESRGKFLTHLLSLSRLYGPVSLTQEAQDFTNEWFKDDRKVITNTHPCLENYYANKQLHVQKYAMAFHFGESTDMVIPLSAIKSAIEFLHYIERNMHLPFLPSAATDSAETKGLLIKKLELETEGITIANLYVGFYRKLTFSEFAVVIEDLLLAKLIEKDSEGRIKISKI